MSCIDHRHFQEVTCPSCEGTGEDWDRDHLRGDPYHHNDCYACDGDGTVTLDSITEYARMNVRSAWMVDAISMALAEKVAA